MLLAYALLHFLKPERPDPDGGNGGKLTRVLLSHNFAPKSKGHSEKEDYPLLLEKA